MSLPELLTATTKAGGLAWREAGDGAALVCLHGLASSSKSWIEQYRGLAIGRRVVAWDCPGYGGSDDLATAHPTVADYAEALGHLLDYLSLSKVDLLGHSMGGAVAACFAGRRPERVRRLILSATKAAFAEPGTDGNAYRTRLEELKALSAEEFGARRAAGLLAPGAAPSLRARTQAIAAAVRPTGYRAACHMLAGCDNRAALTHLAVPTLVLCGALDRVAPLAHSQEIAALLPDSRLEVIEGAAHAPYAERPEDYNAAITRFLS